MFTSVGIIPILLGVILLFKIIFTIDYSDGFSYVFSFLITLPVLLLMYSGVIQMYFIELHKEKIVVKNLLLFWYKQVYFIDEINYVSYKTKKTSRHYWEGIEIYFKNSKKLKKYWMGTPFLKELTFWDNLENELKKVGVKTLNFNNKF